MNNVLGFPRMIIFNSLEKTNKNKGQAQGGRAQA